MFECVYNYYSALDLNSDSMQMATPQVDSDLEDFQPLNKKSKCSVLPTERFKAPTSDETMEKIYKGFVPPNTQKN